MLSYKSNFITTKAFIIPKMNLIYNKSSRIILFSFFIVLIDQISKSLVLNTIGYERSINIIPNFLNLTLVKNKGAAFSIFSNSTTLLTIISVFAALLLINLIIKSPPRSYWNSIGITYLFGGTLGNGIDRLFKGYVLDFFDLVPINFPIFNIADIAINIAIICFVFDLIFGKDKRKMNLKK